MGDHRIKTRLNTPQCEGKFMPVGEGLENIEINASPDDLDEDGFISLWNVAATTCEGDQEKTRALASAFLGFLCKKEYLDSWFEKDNKILYAWKPDSEMVDVVAQHAEVPFIAFKSFMENQKFKPTANYSPRRADRVEWFTNKWCVG
jgi:hypothetical protein